MGIRFGRLALAAALIFAVSSAVVTKSWASPVTLNAVDRPGGAVLSEPIHWQVLRLDKDGKPVPTPVAVGDAAVLKTDLKPGHYMLVAVRGTLSIKQGLVVGSGEETRNIVVSDANAAVKPTQTAAAGTATTAAPAPAVTKPATAAQAAAAPVLMKPNSKFTIGMIPNSGRGAITDPIAWQVYTYTKGVTEQGQLVAQKTSPSATFNLPAGSYVIRAAYKGTQSDLVIPLAPNQSYNYTINLYAGQAKLTAVKASGGAAKDAVSWQVVREKPGANGAYQLVTTSSDASPQLLIREGNYLVVARQGELWGVQKLSIKAGRTTTTKVKLQKGEGAPIVVASN